MYSLTRWYGRKGAESSAIGAVNTALWDIRTRSLASRCSSCSEASHLRLPMRVPFCGWTTSRLADEASRYVD
jgi:hypothetical protein